MELGACLGVVSWVTNKLLDTPVDHIVVEANPDLINEIFKHRNNNGCAFSVENVIISEKPVNEFYCYNIAISGSMILKAHNSKLKLKRKVEISGVSVSELESKYGLRFNVLIIDIEGAEHEFLEKNKDFLSRQRLLIIEFHPNLFDEVDCSLKVNILNSLGFEEIDSLDKTKVYRK